MLIEQPIMVYGDPQTEDGFVRIATELYEALLEYDFSKNQLKIVMAIIRKTYGYNKKSDNISANQLSKLTNIERANVFRTLKELVNFNILIKNDDGFIQNLTINKYYKTWQTSVIVTPSVKLIPSVTVTPKLVSNSPKTSVTVTPTIDNTIDNRQLYVEILSHLNLKVNRDYKPVKSNINFIEARIKEGYTKDDCIHVIEVKCHQWLKDKNMNQYLRPATLFNATKFSQYHAEQKIIKPNGVVL